MIKSKISAVLISVMIASLTACGNASTPSSSAAQPTSEQTVSASTEKASADSTKKLDFDGSSQVDTGNGTFYLTNQSGSTKDGKAIVVYAGSDDMLIQIGYNTEGINGGSLSYIYIDGVQKDKQQLSDSQMTLDLSGDDLSVDTHKVELVQFENDDPDKTVTTYKSAQYEVKAK